MSIALEQTYPCATCRIAIAPTGKRGRPPKWCPDCADTRRREQRIAYWKASGPSGPIGRSNSAPCAACGKLLWGGGRGSLPAGERLCRPCGGGRRGGRKPSGASVFAPFNADFPTKAQQPGRGGGPWRRLRALVFAEESACFRCGLPVDKALVGTAPRAPTVDHIVSLIDGGAPLDRANVALSHFACNSRAGSWKLARTQEEYAAALRESDLRYALAEMVQRMGYDEVMRILGAS